ncbi:MAG: hypothetical protein Phog2KO_51170 [Phototrophicaceae bacterium]
MSTQQLNECMAAEVLRLRTELERQTQEVTRRLKRAFIKRNHRWEDGERFTQAPENRSTE